MNAHEDTAKDTAKEPLGRSLSFFLTGLVVGLLLAAFGFAGFLRWQKNAEHDASATGARRGNGWF
ncbi:MAG: hypothetical protein HC897_03200 [Thermoanaerobaculia bacterium]|nr:hypothetical protein [Thermoanaerobaculia bacterium]